MRFYCIEIFSICLVNRHLIKGLVLKYVQCCSIWNDISALAYLELKFHLKPGLWSWKIF